MKKVKIIYYTGTGGSKLIAELIKDRLINEDYYTLIERVSHDNVVNKELFDLIIIIFPLHGVNAPEIVYKWIKSLPKGNKTKAAVISVSAGGEVVFNRGGRLSSIKLLEKQDYEVVYENSLIMPSNFLISTPEVLSKALLTVLPDKIDLIVNDVINNKGKRIKPSTIEKIIAKIFEVEKIGVKILGRTIQANENCNGCGLCERTCLCDNIVMKNNKPQFNFKCNFCTCCLYSCPNKALSTRIFKSALLKTGYNIEDFMDNDNIYNSDEIMKLTESIYWRGLRNYILEPDEKSNYIKR